MISPHSSLSCNIYANSSFDIINYSRNNLDLGINESSDCSFDFHISNLVKRTKHLTGWMLRTHVVVVCHDQDHRQVSQGS